MSALPFETMGGWTCPWTRGAKGQGEPDRHDKTTRADKRCLLKDGLPPRDEREETHALTLTITGPAERRQHDSLGDYDVGGCCGCR